MAWRPFYLTKSSLGGAPEGLRAPNSWLRGAGSGKGPRRGRSRDPKGVLFVFLRSLAGQGQVFLALSLGRSKVERVEPLELGKQLIGEGQVEAEGGFISSHVVEPIFNYIECHKII